jgi:hypothetical protein
MSVDLTSVTCYTVTLSTYFFNVNFVRALTLLLHHDTSRHNTGGVDYYMIITLCKMFVVECCLPGSHNEMHPALVRNFSGN